MKTKGPICYTLFYMSIIIIVLMLLLNALLAAYEMALASASRTKLSILAQEKKCGAESALYMKDHMEGSLATIQIGITLIGILTGLYSGEALAYNFAEIIARVPALEPYAIGIAKSTIVIIVTYLTLIFGELVPKRIGMACAERASMLVAKPMNFLSLISSPFVWLLSKSTALAVRMTGINTSEENKVTEEEIKAGTFKPRKRFEAADKEYPGFPIHCRSRFHEERIAAGNKAQLRLQRRVVHITGIAHRQEPGLEVRRIKLIIVQIGDIEDDIRIDDTARYHGRGDHLPADLMAYPVE